MYLSQLKLFHFRNLADQTIVPSPHLNFVLGDNGQGKTNLIEAIHLLAIGKSFRSAETAELIRWGEESGSVFGQLISGSMRKGDQGTQELGLILAPKERKALFNGEELPSVSKLFGRLICISFAPSDLGLVKGSPQLRRSFTDRHMSECKPALMDALLSYQRALRNKTALLKSGKAEPISLEPWDQLMIQAAEQIENARLEFLGKIKIRANNFLGKIAPDDGTLSLLLKSSLGDREIEASQRPFQREEIQASFIKFKTRERDFKSCLVGPHRDDIVFKLADKEARAFASQGQSRSLTLALKLAVIDLLEEEKGDAPLILLDDVDSELDRKRSAALYDLVLVADRQIFLTGTHLDSRNLKKMGDFKKMLVSAGVVQLD